MSHILEWRKNQSIFPAVHNIAASNNSSSFFPVWGSLYIFLVPLFSESKGICSADISMFYYFPVMYRPTQCS